MPRHFTIRKMFRNTPNCLLEAFFRRLDIQLISINWRRLPGHCEDALTITTGLLPRDAQDRMEAALSDIHELADTGGVQAILEAACRLGQPDFPARLPQAGPYHKAMWTWLNHLDVFQQALQMQSVTNLPGWRKRDNVPRVKPQTSPTALRELASAISSFLRCEEGRGQRCTVEHYRRASGMDYFIAYPDDFVQTLTVHDENGTLSARSIRQTFEIAFAYHQKDGTLHLHALTLPKLKVKLESLFGQIILRKDMGPVCYRRPYDLNRLRDRYFCLETDPADRLTATLTALRLQSGRWGKIALEPLQCGHVHDIYDMADHCLDGESVPWDEVDILKASIRFRFESMHDRRAGSLLFHVTKPNRLNIRSGRPERVELVRKYLKRWRIANE